MAYRYIPPKQLEEQKVEIDDDGFVWQLINGFVEGFSTLELPNVSAPSTPAESMARSIGGLLGFVGFIPSVLTPAGWSALGAKAAVKIGSKGLAQWGARQALKIEARHAIRSTFFRNLYKTETPEAIKAMAAKMGIGDGLENLTRWQLAKGSLKNINKEALAAFNRVAVENLDDKAMALAKDIVDAPSFTNLLARIPLVPVGRQLGKSGIRFNSVPMMGADWLMNTGFVNKTLKNSALRLLSKSKWLNDGKMFLGLDKGTLIAQMGHGGMHLGLASSVAALGINPMQWKDRVDDALPAFFSGFTFGAGFGAIGNMGTILGKLGVKGNTKAMEGVLRAVAGGIFQGLPSTMRKADSTEQIYEYLLGAWFGFHSPTQSNYRANKHFQRTYADLTSNGTRPDGLTDIMLDPTLIDTKFGLDKIKQWEDERKIPEKDSAIPKIKELIYSTFYNPLFSPIAIDKFVHGISGIEGGGIRGVTNFRGLFGKPSSSLVFDRIEELSVDPVKPGDRFEYIRLVTGKSPAEFETFIRSLNGGDEMWEKNFKNLESVNVIVRSRKAFLDQIESIVKSGLPEAKDADGNVISPAIGAGYFDGNAHIAARFLTFHEAYHDYFVNLSRQSEGTVDAIRYEILSKDESFLSALAMHEALRVEGRRQKLSKGVASEDVRDLWTRELRESFGLDKRADKAAARILDMFEDYHDAISVNNLKKSVLLESGRYVRYRTKDDEGNFGWGYAKLVELVFDKKAGVWKWMVKPWNKYLGTSGDRGNASTLKEINAASIDLYFKDGSFFEKDDKLRTVRDVDEADGKDKRLVGVSYYDSAPTVANNKFTNDQEIDGVAISPDDPASMGQFFTDYKNLSDKVDKDEEIAKEAMGHLTEADRRSSFTVEPDEAKAYATVMNMINDKFVSDRSYREEAIEAFDSGGYMSKELHDFLTANPKLAEMARKEAAITRDIRLARAIGTTEPEPFDESLFAARIAANVPDVPQERREPQTDALVSPSSERVSTGGLDPNQFGVLSPQDRQAVVEFLVTRAQGESGISKAGTNVFTSPDRNTREIAEFSRRLLLGIINKDTINSEERMFYDSNFDEINKMVREMADASHGALNRIQFDNVVAESMSQPELIRALDGALKKGRIRLPSTRDGLLDFYKKNRDEFTYDFWVDADIEDVAHIREWHGVIPENVYGIKQGALEELASRMTQTDSFLTMLLRDINAPDRPSDPNKGGARISTKWVLERMGKKIPSTPEERSNFIRDIIDDVRTPEGETAYREQMKEAGFDEDRITATINDLQSRLHGRGIALVWNERASKLEDMSPYVLQTPLDSEQLANRLPDGIEPLYMVTISGETPKKIFNKYKNTYTSYVEGRPLFSYLGFIGGRHIFVRASKSEIDMADQIARKGSKLQEIRKIPGFERKSAAERKQLEHDAMLTDFYPELDHYTTMRFLNVAMGSENADMLLSDPIKYKKMLKYNKSLLAPSIGNKSDYVFRFIVVDDADWDWAFTQGFVREGVSYRSIHDGQPKANNTVPDGHFAMFNMEKLSEIFGLRDLALLKSIVHGIDGAGRTFMLKSHTTSHDAFERFSSVNKDVDGFIPASIAKIFTGPKNVMSRDDLLNGRKIDESFEIFELPANAIRFLHARDTKIGNDAPFGIQPNDYINNNSLAVHRSAMEDFYYLIGNDITRDNFVEALIKDSKFDEENVAGSEFNTRVLEWKDAILLRNEDPYNASNYYITSTLLQRYMRRIVRPRSEGGTWSYSVPNYRLDLKDRLIGRREDGTEFVVPADIRISEAVGDREYALDDLWLWDNNANTAVLAKDYLRQYIGDRVDDIHKMRLKRIIRVANRYAPRNGSMQPIVMVQRNPKISPEDTIIAKIGGPRAASYGDIYEISPAELYNAQNGDNDGDASGLIFNIPVEYKKRYLDDLIRPDSARTGFISPSDAVEDPLKSVEFIDDPMNPGKNRIKNVNTLFKELLGRVEDSSKKIGVVANALAVAINMDQARDRVITPIRIDSNDNIIKLPPVKPQMDSDNYRYFGSLEQSTVDAISSPIHRDVLGEFSDVNRRLINAIFRLNPNDPDYANAYSFANLYYQYMLDMVKATNPKNFDSPFTSGTREQLGLARSFLRLFEKDPVLGMGMYHWYVDNAFPVKSQDRRENVLTKLLNRKNKKVVVLGEGRTYTDVGNDIVNIVGYVRKKLRYSKNASAADLLMRDNTITIADFDGLVSGTFGNTSREYLDMMIPIRMPTTPVLPNYSADRNVAKPEWETYDINEKNYRSMMFRMAVEYDVGFLASTPTSAGGWGLGSDNMTVREVIEHIEKSYDGDIKYKFKSIKILENVLRILSSIQDYGGRWGTSTDSSGFNNSIITYELFRRGGEGISIIDGKEVKSSETFDTLMFPMTVEDYHRLERELRKYFVDDAGNPMSSIIDPLGAGMNDGDTINPSRFEQIKKFLADTIDSAVYNGVDFREIFLTPVPYHTQVPGTKRDQNMWHIDKLFPEFKMPIRFIRDYIMGPERMMSDNDVINDRLGKADGHIRTRLKIASMAGDKNAIDRDSGLVKYENGSTTPMHRSGIFGLFYDMSTDRPKMNIPRKWELDPYYRYDKYSSFSPRIEAEYNIPYRANLSDQDVAKYQRRFFDGKMLPWMAEELGNLLADSPDIIANWNGYVESLIGKPYISTVGEYRFVTKKLREHTRGSLDFGILRRQNLPVEIGRQSIPFDRRWEVDESVPGKFRTRVMSSFGKNVEGFITGRNEMNRMTHTFSEMVRMIFEEFANPSEDVALPGYGDVFAAYSGPKKRSMIDSLKEVSKQKNVKRLNELSMIRYEGDKDSNKNVKDKEHRSQIRAWERVREEYNLLSDKEKDYVNYRMHHFRRLNEYARDNIIPMVERQRQKNWLYMFKSYSLNDAGTSPEDLEFYNEVLAKRNAGEVHNAFRASFNMPLLPHKWKSAKDHLDSLARWKQAVIDEHRARGAGEDAIANISSKLDSYIKKSVDEYYNGGMDELLVDNGKFNIMKSSPYLRSIRVYDKDLKNIETYGITPDGYILDPQFLLFSMFKDLSRVLVLSREGYNARIRADETKRVLLDKGYDKEQVNRYMNITDSYIRDQLAYLTTSNKAPRLIKALVGVLSGTYKSSNYSSFETDISDLRVVQKLNAWSKKTGINLNLNADSIARFANAEARYELASLLFYPKSILVNIFGSSMNTLATSSLGEIKTAFDALRDPRVRQSIKEKGVIAEFVREELMIASGDGEGKYFDYFSDVAKIYAKHGFTQEGKMMVEKLSADTGVPARILKIATVMTSTTEQYLRSMAYIIGHNRALSFGFDEKAARVFAHNYIAATQYLYHNSVKPEFARSSLGKVLTRFMTYMWSTVAFQNEMKRHGEFQSEYTKALKGELYPREAYARWALAMTVMLAFATLYPYSIFDSTVPPHMAYTKDVAAMLFGGEDDRKKAFYGSYGASVMFAPLPNKLMLTPMLTLMNQDYMRYLDYHVWTLFPFGRMARGMYKTVTNPSYSMETLFGIPYQSFAKHITLREKNKTQRMAGPYLRD